jgi:hypothetical protein
MPNKKSAKPDVAIHKDYLDKKFQERVVDECRSAAGALDNLIDTTKRMRKAMGSIASWKRKAGNATGLGDVIDVSVSDEIAEMREFLADIAAADVAITTLAEVYNDLP